MRDGMERREKNDDKMREGKKEIHFFFIHFMFRLVIFLHEKNKIHCEDNVIIINRSNI